MAAKAPHFFITISNQILKEFHCGYHSYLMCLIALALLFFLFIVVTLSQLSLSVWLCKKNDVLLAYL